MASGLRKIFRSVRFALKGLSHAYRADKSFRLEILWGIPLYAAVLALLWPLSETELILYAGSYILILIVELVNTSIETMLERLHPEDHELIGRSKDIASAAVLMAFFFAMIVTGSLALSRF